MKICPRCSVVYPDDSERCGQDGSPLRKELDKLLGKTIAQRYRLISRVGAGKVSIVYLARHVMIDRLSALKILRPHLASDVTLCERFLHEARAVNRINHDNIVEISDYGEANGTVYLVMEYVPGDTMRKHLDARQFPWPRAARIGVQIAAALGRAHQMGVVHRDLNPSSVLLVEKKEGPEGVKLIDFGVSKMLDHPGTGATDVARSPYAAPETIFAGRTDPQSDLYALGAILYEALSGAVPTPSPASHGDAHGAPPLHPLIERAPHVPESLCDLVMQMLAHRPEQRPKDAFLVLDELGAVLREQAAPRTSSMAPARSSMAPRPPSAAPARSSMAPRPPYAVPARPPEAPATQPSAGPPRLSAPTPVGPVSPDSYHPPDTNARPLADLEPLCREGLERVERAMARYGPPSAEAHKSLAEVRRLIEALSVAGQAVQADQANIAELETRASDIKRSFGRALDELGHDLSRANALVADLDGRIERLQRLRDESLHEQGGRRDAWLWEQAALTEEVRRARGWGDDLTFQIRELRSRLDEQTEQIDTAVGRVRAALEGHVAALRTLARETWGSIEQSARGVGVPLSLVGPRHD